jgi:hypothetical protein
MLGFISCDDDNKDSEDDSLYVKFINDSDSEYTITGIQLLNMGVAGVEELPVGEFGDNILTDGQVIAPGEHLFFTLDIPNLNYAYYRLTVNDGAGNQVFLQDQVDYQASYDGVIEHWGGDDRTVQVTIKWNNEYDYIYVQSWSNWVGID